MTSDVKEVSQVTIREMVDFAAGLTRTLEKFPEGEKVLEGVKEALSAECVQCGIKLNGAEILKFGAGETAGDAKLERLASGYCARNGCDSHYYRIHKGAHPLVDWAKILAPVQELATNAAVSEAAEARFLRLQRHHKNGLRIATAIGALVIVFILRQIYMGGTIPFIREAEDFKVDREPATGLGR